ncbi:Sodium/sulfate symporter [Anaeromyces robustus]|uniref:Sodium/sulfate symporter n=1 Tax=Anaeromyces robustus TaxID=1754192 RepID=A0A1Y1XEC5_9FUNG|nr:Sodium/sulfate symporter [Anaeromyces robustus]|eukprot:ORX84118.1 Sodium/sulfate symporter [Anaeromyces robustus]
MSISNRRNSLDEVRIMNNDSINLEENNSLLHRKREGIFPSPLEQNSLDSVHKYTKKELLIYAICFIVAIIIWNISIENKKDITPTSMHLFAVFIFIVLSLLFTKARISIVIAIALSFLSLTKNFKCRTIDNIMVDCSKCGKPINPDNNDIIYKCQGSKGAFSVALSGYSDSINWLVFFAYQIGKCIEKTGLGKRISYIILKHFGSSLKGIGYAIFIIEIILAPFIPSNVARGGCIVLPIINSIIENISQNYRISSKASEFLYLCGNHANLIISSIYLTGSASNPVLMSKVVSIYGSEYDLSFLKWFIGAIIPATLVIILVPQAISIYLGQNNIDLEQTKNYSERMLNQMREMSRDEKCLCMIFGFCLLMWTTTSITGIDTSLITFIGVLLLVVLKVISWDDIISNKKAWDTFFWLGGMIVMANQLSELGISSLIGEYIGTFIEYIPLLPIKTVILFIFYFLTMLLFSSLTGHVIALAGPFMNAAEKLNIPKGLTVAFLAYYTLLCACLTHYSCGTSVMYYSQSRIKTKQFITIGIIISLIIIIIYSTIGSLWWKILGWS